MGGDVRIETTVNARFIALALEMLICDNETSVCILKSTFHIEFFRQGKQTAL